MDTLHIELTEAIIIICWIIFLLIFPQGLKEFYQHILPYSSYFSHRVFGGDLIEDGGSLWSQAVIRGSVRNN